jgi:aldose 1-epimerase
MKNRFYFLLICSLFLNQSCNMKREIKLLNKNNFFKNINGKETTIYVLKNRKGLVSEITNYGARVVSLWVPDNNGNFDDIVLGFDNIDDYINAKQKYFGATIGRYGNRIKEGKFIINDKEYSLEKNNGLNHLHGGNMGFGDVVWNAKQIDNQTLELNYFSKNMEEGYPGNLNVKIIYHLNNNDELKIEYFAKTDESTHVNLTHHSFFNLLGAGNETINEHLLYINANSFTPVDETLIPTGNIELVANTPFDFSLPTAIGKRINQDNNQLNYGKGYDHNYVLNNSQSEEIIAAKVFEKESGRTLEVYTNEPGIQFYGGNFLSGTIGKHDKSYKKRAAFCLETQHFPNSPNQDNFPSTLLKPNEEYYSICIYKFSTN